MKLNEVRGLLAETQVRFGGSYWAEKQNDDGDIFYAIWWEKNNEKQQPSSWRELNEG